MTDAFWTLHRGLPREGPGEPADVAWAAALAGVAPDARILDAGCGPGADIAALRAASPEGQVTAVDLHPPFVDAARAACAADPGVTVAVGDMAAEPGPFDFVWSAGAVYFRGVRAALAAWRDALAPGGAVAFSAPCFFVPTPTQGARALWAGAKPVRDADGIAAEIAAAGYRLLGTRRLGDAAWEAYYRPLEARITELRPGADAALGRVLDDAEREIALWRAHRAETGYLLGVVAPA